MAFYHDHAKCAYVLTIEKHTMSLMPLHGHVCMQELRNYMVDAPDGFALHFQQASAAHPRSMGPAGQSSVSREQLGALVRSWLPHASAADGRYAQTLIDLALGMPEGGLGLRVRASV